MPSNWNQREGTAYSPTAVPPTAEIGVWEETYEAGGIKEEYQYFTHPEGQQKIKHGWYRSHYPVGTPQSTGAYRSGGKISAGEKRHGRWVCFDIHRRDSDEDIWRNGEFVERCEGDEI